MIDRKSYPASLSLPQKVHLLKTDGFWRPQVCRVPLEFQVGQYLVRTIDSFEEFLEVMQLRHLVFQKEFARKRFCIRSDRDQYDSHADFLVVKDVSSKRIVGCYRLICSRFTNKFYSASEFNIDDFLGAPGEKVELSRACILPPHRNGRVINLLWRGIVQYVQLANARYFFGCGSIPTIDPNQVMEVMKEFRAQGVYSETYHLPVLKKYQMPEPSPNQPSVSKVEIPHLLRAYFKAGARVCSGPAIDRKFRCTDFVIVIDLKSADATYRQKYAAN